MLGKGKPKDSFLGIPRHLMPTDIDSKRPDQVLAASWRPVA